MALPRDLDVQRLCRAVARSRLALRRPREERREMVRQTVGFHWSEEGTQDRVPFNLLALYQSVLSPSLIAKNPRVSLSTFRREHKPVVSAMQSWANAQVQHVRLAETLQRVVTDALYSVGVCKVALASPADAASYAWNLSAGEPFAARVDLDDLVFDIHARAFEEVGFIGHRFRVPLDAVRDSKLYNKNRLKLTPQSDPLYNKEGDERIGVLGRTFYTNWEEYEDFVDLWELYLPRHRLVVTLADSDLGGPEASGAGGEPIRVQSWVGPDCGPYHVLGFGVVPGNIMPKAPVQDLYDLHLAANEAGRKLIRTIQRMKEVTLITQGAMESGTRVVNANDGEMLQVSDPKNFVQVPFSGTHLEKVTATFMLLMDKFTYLAGNLDAMGGLAPQAKTLGQDQLLTQNASRMVADKQERTVGFTAGVVESLCWFWHHNPVKVMRATHSVAGLPELSLVRGVTPQQRQQVPFADLEVKIDPYSLQYQTPQSRLQTLQTVMTQVVMPIMPLLAQQGISIDLNTYLKRVGEYLDMPDLAEILTIREPPNPGTQGAGGGEPPRMPQSTTRSYVRENRSEQTREASDRNLISSMMGVDTGGNPNRNGKPQGSAA